MKGCPAAGKIQVKSTSKNCRSLATAASKVCGGAQVGYHVLFSLVRFVADKHFITLYTSLLPTIRLGTLCGCGLLDGIGYVKSLHPISAIWTGASLFPF